MFLWLSPYHYTQYSLCLNVCVYFLQEAPIFQSLESPVLKWVVFTDVKDKEVIWRALNSLIAKLLTQIFLDFALQTENYHIPLCLRLSKTKGVFIISFLFKCSWFTLLCQFLLRAKWSRISLLKMIRDII